ncbi:MAG: sensor histidine kinase, partial [Clostridia bacterium]|nr:sensor histidine kinase [Clostridia bacterium]
MNQLFSKAILFMYSLSMIMFVRADMLFVVSLLISLIFTTSIYFCNHKLYSQISTCLFSFASFFFPELLYFAPVLGYDAMKYHSYPALFLLAASCFLRHFNRRDDLLWILCLGIVISCYLAYNESSYTKLHQLYQKTRDDSTELNLLLEEKNKHLLEKQDYEIYNATLKERNRIAREIHDNVGHILSRSILLLGAIRTINKDETLGPSLGSLAETLDTAMNNIRTSVHDLHDESVNLKEATQNLVQSFTFCSIDCNYDMGDSIPREVKYCFIAILKEGLANIERHSNATHVNILEREHPGLYQLLIHDNGTTKGELYGKGIGLSNMKDRVDSLKGSIQITQENGFRIFIT